MTPKKGKRAQAGFTLIELLVAAAIASIIGISVTIAIYQIVDTNSRNTSHQTAIKDVENAVHWLTRDAQMAQTVTPSSPSGLPLTLNWVEWNDTSNTVVYSLQNGALRRSYSKNGGTSSNTTVAKYISSDSEMTSVQFSGGTLDVRMTAAVGGFRPISETRTFKVLPRSIQ